MFFFNCFRSCGPRRAPDCDENHGLQSSFALLAPGHSASAASWRIPSGTKHMHLINNQVEEECAGGVVSVLTPINHGQGS